MAKQTRQIKERQGSVTSVRIEHSRVSNRMQREVRRKACIASSGMKGLRVHTPSSVQKDGRYPDFCEEAGLFC